MKKYVFAAIGSTFGFSVSITIVCRNFLFTGRSPYNMAAIRTIVIDNHLGTAIVVSAPGKFASNALAGRHENTWSRKNKFFTAAAALPAVVHVFLHVFCLFQLSPPGPDTISKSRRKQA